MRKTRSLPAKKVNDDTDKPCSCSCSLKDVTCSLIYSIQGTLGCVSSRLEQLSLQLVVFLKEVVLNESGGALLCFEIEM